MIHKPEILAPAGSLESVYAAVRCGADAVYLGGKEFSARGNATNFTEDELKEAVSYCHLNGVSVHQAINTIAFDKNFSDVLKVAVRSAEIGVDAFIIQDLGVFSVIKNALPSMPLHASTQMTIHSVDGAKKAMDMGFSRVVLSRELSLSAIEEICKLPVEVEVFIHGALCMSVSGQCFMSAMIGGRSANRGLCAQSCRLPFSADKSDYYALSLKDLSYIPEIHSLVDAGVKSFKIEGRMKRPEYVASAVNAVKNALSDEKYDMSVLKAVFSRGGFTDGYLKETLGRNMFGIREKEDVISAKDYFPEIRELYRRDVGRREISFSLKARENEEMKLTTLCDGKEVTVSGDVPKPAENKPSDEIFFKEKLSKLGGTPFIIKEITCDVDENIFVPASAVNDIRRKAVEEISVLLTENKKHIVNKDVLKKGERYIPQNAPYIRVSVKKAKQTEELSDKVKEIILPLSEYEKVDASDKILLSLPRFIKDEKSVRETLLKAKEKGFSHVYCNNIAHLETAKNLGLICHAGYGMNIANSYSLDMIKDMGATDTELSFEMKLTQISALSGDIKRGIITYGRLPLMLTRNCPIKSQIGCKNCKKILTDRKGMNFPVYCYNDYAEVLNCNILYLGDKKDEIKSVDFMTMLFYDETAEEINKVIDDFVNKKNPPADFTRGLYMRGVE
ncbi:MAG: U32 family peptidase [Oscillospiraceae bacterium]|nr:U32 family peptidase [Oscillospiraceae bacterium]